MKSLLLCAALFCLTPLAHASGSADDLADQCKAIQTSNPTDADLANGAYCLGFVNGVVSSESLAKETFHPDVLASKSHFCVPSGANGKELALVFLKFIENHPETRHLPATIVIWRALSATYPCSV